MKRTNVVITFDHHSLNQPPESYHPRESSVNFKQAFFKLSFFKVEITRNGLTTPLEFCLAYFNPANCPGGKAARPDATTSRGRMWSTNGYTFSLVLEAFQKS